MIAEAKADGEREREKILERARQAAQKILEEAGHAAEREMERAKKRLQQETLEQALRHATETLKKTVTDKEHRQFADELVTQLEKHDGATR